MWPHSLGTSCPLPLGWEPSVPYFLSPPPQAPESELPVLSLRRCARQTAARLPSPTGGSPVPPSSCCVSVTLFVPRECTGRGPMEGLGAPGATGLAGVAPPAAGPGHLSLFYIVCAGFLCGEFT